MPTSISRIIECVPNFSDGRNPATLKAIVATMSATPDVYVLAQEADADHNRGVVTIAGEPEAVAHAALLGVGKAMELIDLTKHSGVHPRIGATDVLPFVPVAGVNMKECVALAHRAGQEIWQRYHIPVYFYEAAATQPHRVRLENLRRGQFEGLRDTFSNDTRRSPDIGDAIHPTAGATAVGARQFLIAYNINLDTSDVKIAKNIAKAIRTSSGGLPYVKAIGVKLESRNVAQVSMNLTDFQQTPMHRVYEAVKQEAACYGAKPIGSEIVGLIPRKAVEISADFFSHLDNFSLAQIFENRLEAALGSAHRSP
ncbi:MAG: glutamate formimidoyltransferase [Candidatus Acidiferrum sp.]